MHVIRPDDNPRNSASRSGSISVRRDDDSSRSDSLSSAEKIDGKAFQAPASSDDASVSLADNEIPALLDPYCPIPDEYVAEQPTAKARKKARAKQKRRARRRANLDKQLDKYSRKHPEASPEEVFRAVFPSVERKRTKKKRPIGSILVMLFGALLLAFPIVSDLYANWQAEQAITSYTQVVESMTQEEKDSILAKAISYNHRLAGESTADDVDLDGVDYYDILNTTHTGVIGSVMIECIGVNQPIYHGTDENTLMAGVGHLEGTSFPLPTGSTHAAIAGHTGMPGQRMFDELVDLEPGDKLHIKVLDEDTWYQVLDSEVVDPDQKNTFTPEPGRDLLTLITCTPYGINDHRLLVHCEKIEQTAQDQTDFGVVTEDKISKYVNLRTIPVMITVLLLLFGLIWKIMKVLRGRKKTNKQAQDEKRRRKAQELEEAVLVGGRRYAARVREPSTETSPNHASKSSNGTPL